MIITRITGGLGNQLFQYAAGLALARVREVPLFLDLRWFDSPAHREKHEVFALARCIPGYREASARELCLVSGLGRSSEERLSALLLRLWLKIGRRSPAVAIKRIDDGDFGFNPLFFDLPEHVYLAGNWQSEKFFAPVAADLRTLLNGFRPAHPTVVTLADTIRSIPSVFVHVRRGDYVSNPHFRQEIGPVGSGYYRKAWDELRRSVGPCHPFVFTNDPAWCQTNLPMRATLVSHLDVPDAIDVLHLMSLCDHAIMANSSLGWWGAWLKDHPDKFVCAPSPWFTNSWRNTSDLLPVRWHQYPR